VRLFRNDKQPFLGKTNAAAALVASPAVWTWEPAASDVSASDDLGYTYGTYKITANEPGKIIESGNYFRIWKRENRAWKVLFDVTNPIPPEENKN
jgi:hypothetical protein